jgi:hypothetical protein
MIQLIDHPNGRDVEGRTFYVFFNALGSVVKEDPKEGNDRLSPLSLSLESLFVASSLLLLRILETRIKGKRELRDLLKKIKYRERCSMLRPPHFSSSTFFIANP